MSDKVISSRFRIDIDRMIDQGCSSRAISQWLAKRGETISHVTLSAYRKSEPEEKSTVQNIEYKTKDEAHRKLIDLILQKAVENPNSPTKLRAYVDAYLKLSNQVKEDEVAPMDRRQEEFSHLSKEERLQRLKEIVLKSFEHFHPYYQVHFSEITSELHDDFKNWRRDIELILTPLFEGKLPCVC